MKARLIKKDDHYFLEVKKYTWHPINQFDEIIANTFNKPQGDILQLSFKNCEAIELGYDINQLATKVYRDFPNKTNGDEPLPMWGKDEHAVKKRKAFIKGFNAAVEILSDKKFSEEDIKFAWAEGELGIHSHNHVLNSLQQTEWDVELVMDRIPADRAPEGWEVFPKLDAEGCLILKKI